MKQIQEKITNDTAYRNHLYKLNEENVKLKKEVRQLQERLSKAEKFPISGVTQSNRRVHSKSIYTDHNVPHLMKKYLNEIWLVKPCHIAESRN